jgi:hypothetical protein
MAWFFSKPIYLSARDATLAADQITSRPKSHHGQWALFKACN